MMEQLTDHHYEILTVPEESAANCIYIKGASKRDFLLHRPADESPDSVSVSTATFIECSFAISHWDVFSPMLKMGN